jgi:hypothetical protein
MLAISDLTIYLNLLNKMKLELLYGFTNNLIFSDILSHTANSHTIMNLQFFQDVLKQIFVGITFRIISLYLLSMMLESILYDWETNGILSEDPLSTL